jgi:hypothetical protein
MQLLEKLEAYQEEPSPLYWPPQYQEEEPSPIYDHSCSSQSAPQQQYQVEPPPFEVSEELLDMIKVLTNSTRQVVEIMKVHPKQEADILHEE